MALTSPVGCSFTFEDALIEAGLGVRHIDEGRNVPMYRTSLQLMPSGVFSGCTVVSMRPYPASDVERVRSITRSYARAHGEPIAWVSSPILDQLTYCKC